jgi:UrcA family protein
MRKSRFIFRALLMLALPVMFLAPAQAYIPKTDLPSVTVRYQDLDLSTPKDVVRLYARIHAAAVTVCMQSEDIRQVHGAYWREHDACITQAVASAVRTVHNEQLSAYHWQLIRGWKRWVGETDLARAAL